MPHPAVYAATIGAAIAIFAGIAIFNYITSQNSTYESNHHHRRRQRSPAYDYDYIDQGTICTICLDNLMAGSGPSIRYLGCGHVFHEPCIGRWLRSNDTCPNCKKKV